MYQGNMEQFNKVVGHIFEWKYVNPTLQISSDYYLGMRKLDELGHLFSSARYFLWNSFKNDSIYIEEGITDTEAIMWHRAVNWQSTVLWLNHCSDYALQALWLALNLHNETKDRQWYKRAIGHRELFVKVTKGLKTKQSKILRPLIISFGRKPEIRKIREWANTLKHSGLIQLEELKLITNGGIGFQQIKAKPGCEKSNFHDHPEDFIISYDDSDTNIDSVSIRDGIRASIKACNLLRDYVGSIREVFLVDKYFTIKDGSITGRNKNFSY